ncbi:MAG: O-antigen ligase family protein [Candidatus Omnitrophota bacterium]
MFKLLLILIFVRPFFSSRVYPDLNLIYSFLFLGFLAFWVIRKGLSLKQTLPLKYPFGLFLLAIIIAVIFSPNKAKSFCELYKYISCLLLFLITISFQKKDKTQIIDVILWAGLAIGAMAFYQYFFAFGRTLSYLTGENISDPFAVEFLQRQRVLMPFVSPNTLGGYLAMLLPLALLKKSRAWYIVPLAGALLLTKSLGALSSLFLALCVYLYLQKAWQKRKVVLLGLLLLTIGIIFFARQTGQPLHTQPSFSTGMRLNYWQDTFQIILAHPLTGIGLGNFNLHQARYAHNSYLQIWAEMGILGLISFLWLVIAALRYAWKNKNKETALLLATVLVFLIHNFVDFSFFLPEVSLIWWAIMGLLISSTIQENQIR